MHPHRYRIFIGGGLSAVARQAFDGFTIESDGVYRRSSPTSIRPLCTAR